MFIHIIIKRVHLKAINQRIKKETIDSANHERRKPLFARRQLQLKTPLLMDGCVTLQLYHDRYFSHQQSRWYRGASMGTNMSVASLSLHGINTKATAVEDHTSDGWPLMRHVATLIRWTIAIRNQDVQGGQYLDSASIFDVFIARNG